MKQYTQKRDIAHFKSRLYFLLLSESRTIITNLDVILHGFMLQIIYTTVFRVKAVKNNLTLRVRRKITNCIKIFEYTQKMNNIPSIYNETNIYIVFDYINLVKDFILRSAIIVRQGHNIYMTL